MIGCYDFRPLRVDFRWLRRQGGERLVGDYWNVAVGHDSQVHATALIGCQRHPRHEGILGHTLDHEAAGYASLPRKGIPHP